MIAVDALTVTGRRDEGHRNRTQGHIKQFGKIEKSPASRRDP
jgi:hypothetical protein